VAGRAVGAEPRFSGVENRIVRIGPAHRDRLVPGRDRVDAVRLYERHGRLGGRGGRLQRLDSRSLSPHTVNGETVWTGLVPVPRGEHEYQFVINGERWVTDPLAPVQQDDGFGAKNAVLKL
jgi:hypothetical protein